MGRRRTPDDPPADAGTDPGEELPAGDPAAAARSIMLRRLTAAPRTRAELAATLADRGIPEEVAVAALDRFEEVGLVDDAMLAGNYVSARSSGRGRTTLRLELQRRGVPAELIDEALAEVTPEAERQAAEAFARKRAASTVGLAAEVRLRRLVGQLARRGFPPGLAFEVAREVLGSSVDTGGAPVDAGGESGNEVRSPFD